MSSEQKAPVEIGGAAEVEPPVKKRAVTLYAIIIFKLVKGLLCVALALVLYYEGKPTSDISKDWQSLLHSPFVTRVFGELKIHGESKFFIALAKSVGELTAANVHRAAWGALLLSLFPLVEGIGLMFRVSWAGWLAIGESAFFIPIEFYAMMDYELVKARGFPWSIFAVTVINIIIVWYLYDNREVLFRHHHPHPHSLNNQ
jgi:uncharacterized membrane protein (DUF2068 family)